MRSLKLVLFLNLLSCSVSLYKGDIQMLKDDLKSIKAPYPDHPMIGLSFDAISKDQNAIISASFQVGYTWKGEAEPYSSPNIYKAVETKFTYFQGSFNFGILPFPKVKPYIYPLVGIGLGIFNSQAFGLHDVSFTTVLYPFLRGGLNISYPISKKIGRVKISDFSPGLNFSAGYQFSFERWLQGPYVIVGYSGFFPPEGIWAVLLGGLLLVLGGR
ncbi:MAG: hypothetical protein ABDH49_00625 [Candidatus Hydrothermales bacterium]